MFPYEKNLYIGLLLNHMRNIKALAEGNV